MNQVKEKQNSIMRKKEYTGAWLLLFEQIMKYGSMTTGADHPVMVNDRYVMAPSQFLNLIIQKCIKANRSFFLGAGREKKIYAVPPYTSIVSLDFEDYPFEAEQFHGKTCALCGAEHVFLDEIIHEEDGSVSYQCNDTSYCLKKKKCTEGRV